jgi:hypothetical protein
MRTVFTQQSTDAGNNQPSDSFLVEFRGSNKLSRRRWDLWRTEFEQYALRVDLPEATRLRARAAADAMAEAVTTKEEGQPNDPILN